ncbi:hypothetical protein PoB_002872700 [Plakobranchus ocellatus]|uniref:Uncharacterized protein n=1 Tax=Plakobranchus ocellatus TaxID=259542 RepID=A0AAV4A5P1_9GAST|nr:hypothetical protein PoB_002872700 [Plakobranchus ocellatus]
MSYDYREMYLTEDKSGICQTEPLEEKTGLSDGEDERDALCSSDSPEETRLSTADGVAVREEGPVGISMISAVIGWLVTWLSVSCAKFDLEQNTVYHIMCSCFISCSLDPVCDTISLGERVIGVRV